MKRNPIVPMLVFATLMTLSAGAELSSATLAASGPGVSAEKGAKAQAKAFVGSWEGVFTPEEGGPPPFRILMTFGADGTAVVSDVGPPTPQLASLGHGAWERTGENEFTVIYRQLIVNADGNLENLFKGRVRFTLDPAAKRVDGPVIVTFYDTEGAELFSGQGVIACQKIQVQPLD